MFDRHKPSQNRKGEEVRKEKEKKKTKKSPKKKKETVTKQTKMHSQPSRVLSNVVAEDDRPHTRLARATLAHEQNLFLLWFLKCRADIWPSYCRRKGTSGTCGHGRRR